MSRVAPMQQDDATLAEVRAHPHSDAEAGMEDVLGYLRNNKHLKIPTRWAGMMSKLGH